MWVNRVPRASSVEAGYHDAGFVVASADSAEGPFIWEDTQPFMRYRGGADFGLVTNAERTRAWIAYGAWLKKNLANKIFGYLARCEFWAKIGW